MQSLYPTPVFRRSSAVEQLTVNQLVVGSIPTAGAIKKTSAQALVFLFENNSVHSISKTFSDT